jgi:transcriptional antiterminator RfaH
MELPWYAMYTKPRHEKSVMVELDIQGIEAWLPLRRELKQWSDRKKWVEEPLIRSYVFVRAIEKNYYPALNVPGALRYIWFEGKAATIPDKQINILKVLTGSDLPIEALPVNLKPGARVRVRAGSLIGMEGELASVSGTKKVIIRIDHLETVISVSINPALLEVIPETPAEKQEREKKYKRFW